MHLLLTDRMICPRCGPGFGLVLMADRLAGRRVESGHLGCANCRERYPIESWVADLRPAPRLTAADEPARGIPAGTDRAMFATGIAAAMGAGERGLPVLLVGAAGEWASDLRGVLPADVEIVCDRVGAGAPDEGVSRVLVGEDWPFPDGSFGGVAVVGGDSTPARLRTWGRLLDPRYRLVVIDPPEGVQLQLGGAGLTRFVQGPGLAAAGR